MGERHARPLVPTLVEELLEEIFLRLPTPDALARASTACTSFRRIITARAFLRRFRKLHPPPYLGFLVGAHGFFPAEAPHPSAPLARAVASAADFSYSFVPRDTGVRWVERDVRDGRVLLEIDSGFNGFIPSFEDLAVCDPLSRRYVLLPPVPMCLTAHAQEDRLVRSMPVLSPTSEDEDETSFRVIYIGLSETKLVAFVFSSVTGQWSLGASTSWNSMGVDAPNQNYGTLFFFNYACGCFYWMHIWRDRLLALDVRKLEFSTVDNQTCFGTWPRGSRPTIVRGREGTPEVLYFGDCSGDGKSVFFRTTKQNRGESSSKRLSDDVIPLPCQYNYLTLAAVDEFVLLSGTPKDQKSALHRGIECFSLDVKTSKVVKVSGMPGYCRAHLYFGFPPSWTDPRI